MTLPAVIVQNARTTRAGCTEDRAPPAIRKFWRLAIPDIASCRPDRGEPQSSIDFPAIAGAARVLPRMRVMEIVLWVTLALAYAWSVWNLARQTRFAPAQRPHEERGPAGGSFAVPVARNRAADDSVEESHA